MKTKLNKKSTNKNKLNFGASRSSRSSRSSLSGLTLDTRKTKLLVGRDSLAGRQGDKREHVITFLTRIRGVLTTDGLRAASENFNHITAADDLKAFTYSNAWDDVPNNIPFDEFAKNSNGVIPLRVIPTPRRLNLIGVMSEIVNFDIDLGEARFEQSKTTRFGAKKNKTKFGTQQLSTVPEKSAAPVPPSPPQRTESVTTQPGDDGVSEITMGSATSSISMASTESSFDTLEQRTSQLIHRYMALWYFATHENQRFLETGVASDDIKQNTILFFNDVGRYYGTTLSEQGLPANPTLIKRLQRAASGLMLTPDGMASFGMGYAHLASMKLQELYVMVSLNRPVESAEDSIKKASYKQIIEDAKTLETRPHSAYMYNRLKKWLSINKDYDTPRTQIEWYRIQTIYFVRRRLLKYKKVLKIINFFAENILSNRIFIQYIAQGGRAYSKRLILKTCIAEITAAISGIFYMQNEARLPTDRPLPDSAPTTLRNVALVIFTQLAIIEGHMNLPQVETPELRQRRAQPLLSEIPDSVLRENETRHGPPQPVTTAYINLQDPGELEAWSHVYKIASLILEQIIELSRVQGMQPGIFYDFDDEVLPVELTPDNFWGEEFADPDEIKGTYINNWTISLHNRLDSIPPITIPQKVGLEEPFYFIKNHPKIALYFINIEMENVRTEGLDRALMDFINYFTTNTTATQPNVSLLVTTQEISRNIFNAVLVGKAVAITPHAIKDAITLAVSPLMNASGSRLNGAAMKRIFDMTLCFLEATYTNIPWRFIWQGANANNVLMIMAVVYCLSSGWNAVTTNRARNADNDDDLINLVRHRISQLPIFNKPEHRDKLPIVLEHWATQTSDDTIPNPEFRIVRYQAIYLNLLQKPGLVVIYDEINRKLHNIRRATLPEEEPARAPGAIPVPDPPDVLFKQLNITKIEETLSDPENKRLLEMYKIANSVDGLSQSKGLDTYLSNFDISNIVSIIGNKLTRLARPEPRGARAGRPPSPSGAGGEARFGKLAKVFEPYREFVFDVKKTGDKRGIYVKTRFGVKQVKDDKYGLYVKADGKKFHLYKW